MVLTIVIGIIAAVCLVSSLIFYVLIRSRGNLNSSARSHNEKQQIIHSLRPSIDIITKKLNQDFRFSTSSDKSNRASFPTNQYEENELTHKKQHRSAGSISSSMTPMRSINAATSLFQLRRPRSANWRQGSIVDPNQMALIQFSLPSINNNEKYRRRSVAICNSIGEPRDNPTIARDSTLPSLLSFTITYLKNAQLKIQFHSIQSLPSHIHLQQLTIKVKLAPDGKEKSIHIRKTIQNETTFGDENNEYSVLFSNIPFERLHERTVSMSIHGKDQAKKTIHLGYIGKIAFNQINNFDKENPVDFIHEIEKTKPSSVELLISLNKKDDRQIHVDIQRIKGLKIDQKKPDATCYVKIILLDHHRPLSIKQTKSYHLNSSNFALNEQFDFNIFTYHSNNLDRLMLMFNLYSNLNHTTEYKCIARVKLASPLFCSGSGIIHWQQFKARESFSMWHTLNKEQH